MKYFYKAFIAFLLIISFIPCQLPSVNNSVAHADGRSYSVMGSAEAIEALIGSAKIYTTSKYYYDLEKLEYSQDNQKPIIQNGEAYVSDAFISDVLKETDFSIDEASATVTVDNTVYMKAEELAEIMGFEYLFDYRGFFVYSSETFEHVNGENHIDMYENSDKIYRYVYFDNPSSSEIMEDFRSCEMWAVHPRIVHTAENVAYIKSKCESEDEWQKKYSSVITSANACLNLTSFTADCADADKQTQATQFQAKMEWLTLAYALTGNAIYAEQAVEYMLTLCRWESLAYEVANLTTGHWAMGMAIGYDTFYNYLNQTDEGKEKLETIRKAADKLVFADTIKAYKNEGGPHWITLRDNFLGVIGGGVLCLALSMADEDDLTSDVGYLMENVLKSLQVAVSLYETNGGYYEGVSYSIYMLTNLVNGIEALYHCVGTDYSLGSAVGFKNAGDFLVYMKTPNNTFNFHDCAPGYTTTLLPSWFAYRYGQVNSSRIAYELNKLNGYTGHIMEFMNYSKANELYGESDLADSELDKYFYGAEAGSFRNSFAAAEPTFVGFHGGRTGLPHDSLDGGEFVFEADGVCWAMDLGSDSYSLPNYFSNYKIYRKRPEGENCLVINPSILSDGQSEYFGQTVGESAVLIMYETAPSAAMAAFDLTKLYSRDASAYKRGYYFGDNRHTLTIQDELTLKSNSELYWFMHTKADIEIKDNNTAYLTCDGKTLRADIYCNANGFELVEMEASPLPTSPMVEGQNPNEGVKKLSVHMTNASGDVTIAVKLSPINDYYTPSALETNSIDDWELPKDDIFLETVVTNAAISLTGILTADIQLPKNATSAALFLDGREVSNLADVQFGERNRLNGIDVGSVESGFHSIELIVDLNNGTQVSDICSAGVERLNSKVFMASLPSTGTTQLQTENINFQVKNDYHTVSNTIENGYQIAKTQTLNDDEAVSDYARVRATPVKALESGIVVIDTTLSFNKEGAYLEIFTREDSAFKLGEKIISAGAIKGYRDYRPDEKINIQAIIDIDNSLFTCIVNDNVIVECKSMPAATKLTDIFLEMADATPLGMIMTIFDFSVKHYERYADNVTMSIVRENSAEVKIQIDDTSLVGQQSVCLAICQYRGNELKDVELFDISLDELSSAYSQSFDIFDSATHVKAILIDSVDKLVPVAPHCIYYTGKMLS